MLRRFYQNMRYLQLACCILGASSYILRLPCLHYGKFTRKNDKYFSGVVGETVDGPITTRACVLKCIANKNCLFVNHKKDGSKCELLTSHEGNLQGDANWEFVSTDYSSYQKIGPNCEAFPCNNADANCTTICESPGFHCVDPPILINVATSQNAQASQSTMHSSSFASGNAIDGSASTQSHTKDYEPNMPWFKVVLNKVYLIENIFVHTGSSGRLNGYKLMVSEVDGNYHVCGILAEEFQQTITCRKNGKYVKITDRPSAAPIQIVTIEVNVYQ